MNDGDRRGSEIWKGARRGMGWALGFLFVRSCSQALREGPRPMLKHAVKGTLRLQELAAEMAERAQDIYAEAESEYRAETVGGEGT